MISVMEAQTFSCPACKQEIAGNMPPGALLRCPHCERPIRMPRSNDRDTRLDVFRAIDPANRKATNAMLCSIVGLLCCPFVGLIGIILGLRVPKAETEDADERRVIRRRRTIAITLGCLSVVVYSVVGVLIYPNLQRGAAAIRADRAEATCRSKIERIARALEQHYTDNAQAPYSLTELTRFEWLNPEDLVLTINQRDYPFQYVKQFDPMYDIYQIVVFDHPKVHRDGGGHVIRASFAIEYLPKADFEREIANTTLPDGSVFNPNAVTD